MDGFLKEKLFVIEIILNLILGGLLGVIDIDDGFSIIVMVIYFSYYNRIFFVKYWFYGGFIGIYEVYDKIVKKREKVFFDIIGK